MLTAYYSRGCDSEELFADKKIVKCENYEEHRNKYNVLYLNMQEFLSKEKTVDKMFSFIAKVFVKEVRKEFPEIDFLDETDLGWSIADAYQESQIPFVILIDEWDCIFREYKDNREEQESIPNKEISREFVSALSDAEWGTVVQSIKKSDPLLEAIWQGNEQFVASAMEQAHYETSMFLSK